LFGPGQEVIDYLNHGQPRDQLKVIGFEIFSGTRIGPVSCSITATISTALVNRGCTIATDQINRRVFDRHAYVKSWGCHTGEEMSKKWYAATGTRMNWRHCKTNS